ncbi:oxidoreductase [candidate division MSBL1 archaeon SCGC-AAA259O05]|uniref:Oxidoreductase n=1 Tax=candidate division MSBL1 archaeon SCGC-AAA259O05 TaxID=1698271 RepID=A0A133V347_9EURY|nr:oxidoreductase [candidate division MSBL1 archaeon SCGC-AAA259O05]
MKDGKKIPALGFGTWNLTGDISQKMVEKALELGYTHIDTAESYGNESQIGEAIKEYDRSNLFITSKVSPSNLHYEDVLSSCESSLKRLGTSYLDLYLIHWPNEAISLRETLWAMKKLQEKGLVKSIGVSNFGINQLKIAVAVSEAPICVNQVEFHPWLYKKELLEFSKEKDILLTASAPLARTRVLQDELIQKLAKKYDKTPAQITLRWEFQKGVVTIPKTSSEDHLEDNFQLFDWKLDPEDVEKIDNIQKTERCYELNFKAEWAV